MGTKSTEFCSTVPQYQGIANTIVQLSSRTTSDLMALPQSVRQPGPRIRNRLVLPRWSDRRCSSVRDAEYLCL